MSRCYSQKPKLLSKQLLRAVLFCCLIGCGPPAAEQESARNTPAYYDLEGFLNRQIQYLQTTKPLVTKTVTDGQGVAETQKVREINWERELELFKEVDLNRPAIRDYFTLTRQTDPATGYTTETYVKKPGSYTNVDFLEVELDPNRQLRRMRAATQQDNPLLYTQRHLQLSVAPGPDQPRITSYRVQGVQKLILSDSVRYAIDAEVRY